MQRRTHCGCARLRFAGDVGRCHCKHRLAQWTACLPPIRSCPALATFDDMCGSKERTESEWRQVMAGGGFELEQALPLSCGQSVIVGRPV